MTLIPALKGHGRRRAVDRLAELEAENRALFTWQMAADDYFAQLLQDITVTNDAWQKEKERRQVAESELAQVEETIRLRDREIADLKRRVDVGVKAEHVIAKTQEMSADEIRRHCSQTVRVMTLQQAHGIGPVTDPGRV